MPRWELDTSTWSTSRLYASMQASQATIPSRRLNTAVTGTVIGIRLRSSIVVAILARCWGV